MADATINGVAGQPVTLDASPSYDQGPNGAKSTVNRNNFEWRFGDRSGIKTGQPQKITHVYPGPGTYNGIMIARDFAGTPADPNDVNAGPTTFTVTIAPAPVDEPPPADDPPADNPPVNEPPPDQAFGPAPGQPPLDDTPLDPLPDIPLVGLPQIAKKKKGPIASLEAPSFGSARAADRHRDEPPQARRCSSRLRNRSGKIVAHKTKARQGRRRQGCR